MTVKIITFRWNISTNAIYYRNCTLSWRLCPSFVNNTYFYHMYLGKFTSLKYHTLGYCYNSRIFLGKKMCRNVKHYHCHNNGHINYLLKMCKVHPVLLFSVLYCADHIGPWIWDVWFSEKYQKTRKWLKTLANINVTNSW